MYPSEMIEFTDEIITLAEVLGQALSEKAIEKYWQSLKPFQISVVREAFERAHRECDKFPIPKLLIAFCRKRKPGTGDAETQPLTDAERQVFGRLALEFLERFPHFAASIWGANNNGFKRAVGDFSTMKPVEGLADEARQTVGAMLRRMG